jgi:hypothetical protein
VQWAATRRIRRLRHRSIAHPWYFSDRSNDLTGFNVELPSTIGSREDAANDDAPL